MPNTKMFKEAVSWEHEMGAFLMLRVRLAVDNLQFWRCHISLKQNKYSVPKENRNWLFNSIGANSRIRLQTYHLFESHKDVTDLMTSFQRANELS